MKTILLATDFSTRSDRALQRAILLCGEHAAELVLIHVVDDDQAPELVRAAQRESTILLERLAGTITAVDGINCRVQLRLGEPFEQIALAAGEFGADVVAMGPHRKQLLRDIFAGTTIERTMRQTDRPILMANGVPAAPYTTVLLTTDFSEHSRHAILEARRSGLLTGVNVAILHAYADPFRGVLGRASLTRDQIEANMAELRSSTGEALRTFVAETKLAGIAQFCDFAEVSAAATILSRVQSESVDLVVIGTHGGGAVEHVLLGSVAEEVLRTASVDVLVVPRRRP